MIGNAILPSYITKYSLFHISLSVISSLSAVAIALYLNSQGCYDHHGCVFSSSSEEWARFGSYIGGVLGPFYAFLAFGAVLFTVHLQSRQIADFNNRAAIDELQRLVASTSSMVDESLSSHREHNIEPFPVKNFAKLIPYAMSVAESTSTLGASMDDEGRELRKRTMQQFDDLFAADLSILSGELNRLSVCLKAYIEAGGSAMVERIYVYRYRYYLVWLFGLGYQDKDDSAYSYFKVEALIAADAAKEQAKAKAEIKNTDAA